MKKLLRAWAEYKNISEKIAVTKKESKEVALKIKNNESPECQQLFKTAFGNFSSLIPDFIKSMDSKPALNNTSIKFSKIDGRLWVILQDFSKIGVKDSKLQKKREEDIKELQDYFNVMPQQISPEYKTFVFGTDPENGSRIVQLRKMINSSLLEENRSDYLKLLKYLKENTDEVSGLMFNTETLIDKVISDFGETDSQERQKFIDEAINHKKSYHTAFKAAYDRALSLIENNICHLYQKKLQDKLLYEENELQKVKKSVPASFMFDIIAYASNINLKLIIFILFLVSLLVFILFSKKILGSKFSSTVLPVQRP